LSASAPTLALPLRDSRGLRLYGGLLHACAAAGLLALPLPVAGRAALLVALFGSAFVTRRRGSKPPRALELDGEGGCRLIEANGASRRGRLLPGALALPGLVLLPMRLGAGELRDVAIAADALAPADLRRLRVRVRLAA
jgi:hypothetical protein